MFSIIKEITDEFKRAKCPHGVLHGNKIRNGKMKCAECDKQYQTEKEAYFWKMQMYFNRILVALMKYAFPGEVESWGTLEH